MNLRRTGKDVRPAKTGLTGQFAGRSAHRAIEPRTWICGLRAMAKNLQHCSAAFLGE